MLRPLALPVAVLMALGFRQQAGSPQQPTFTGSSVLVPVDVRVLDLHGQPVANLRREDFVVSEDGVAQTITAFAAHALSKSGETEPAARRGGEDIVTPQERRVFLIVLGRGQLDRVSRGIDAAIGFVRSRLLPQDVVAVLAWNRATQFTTDRTFILTVLQRFQRSHESVEREISDWFSGLRGAYVGPELPSSIQANVDKIFVGSPTAGTTMTVAAASSSDDATRRRQEASGALLRRDAQGTDRSPQQLAIERDQEALADAVGAESFDAFIARETKSSQDLDKIFAGVEYLRGVQGEKHLVFVTDGGMVGGVGGSADPEHDVAVRASDARVALDYVQTGGVMPTGPMVLQPGQSPDSVRVMSGFALASLERSAEATGGTGSILSQASSGFDAIDRATRFEYLLGYVPTNRTLKPFVRQIAVKVNRPNVQVLARRSYFATPVRALTSRQLRAYSTILTTTARKTADFKITASAVDVLASPVSAVDVNVSLDPARLVFAPAAGHRVASLDVAVFARTGTTTVTSWHAVDVSGDEPMKDLLSFSVRAPSAGSPIEVTVAVYEYGAEVSAFAVARKPK